MTKTGRPNLYDVKLADEICETIASSNKGLHPLCDENPHWPRVTTIRTWIREIEAFSHKYARAKLDQADFLAEEIIKISDDSSNDTILNDDGKTICNSEYIARSRLRVDSRKWLASKLAPRIYGERIQNEVTATLKQEDAIKELE
jgi:hypothetical protein